MNTTTDKIYDEIREILEKNRDAEKGFTKAAKNAKNPSLKTYFQNKSQNRADFNTRLLREIRATYSQFEVEGSFTGTIHRAWMDVKALFSADDDERMLEESIRGDKAALEEYNDVLDYKNLPVGLRHLLNEQRETIKSDISKNTRLEDLV